MKYQRKFARYFSYNKTENLTITDLKQFDYLLVESTSNEDPRLIPYLSSNFRILDSIRAFSGFSFEKKFLLKIRLNPRIFILEKQ